MKAYESQYQSTAWALLPIYVALIVYASLYPFGDWRNQGLVPWAFLFAPLPRYWSGFDVVANLLGYGPLGALICVGFIRRGKGLWCSGAFAIGLGASLSLVLEAIQTYLPERVPSREDWILNLLGCTSGALAVAALVRFGALERWGRMRRLWFAPDTGGGIALLVLWPVSLLFPAAVPFGLGQVLARSAEAWNALLQDSVWGSGLAWVMRDPIPLTPVAESLVVALGVLSPCLLAHCVVRTVGRRWVSILILLVSGFCISGLSAALSWGPMHAWAWLAPPVQVGLGLALVMALLLALVPARVNAALLMLVVGVHLSLLNQAPESPYFAQTLQAWEQGRFIRFHGLAQWLGWLWPYAALLFIVSRLFALDDRLD